MVVHPERRPEAIELADEVLSTGGICRFANKAEEVIKGINYIADGSNLDDEGDFRPGTEAAKEMGIRSPLKEAGLTKEDVRNLSRGLGLLTWNKPSFACLASRFPYGDKITSKALEIVNEAEEYLYNLGFEQVRVRHHQSLARIEVSQDEIEQFLSKNLRKNIAKKFKGISYTYVTLDLEGYKSGSMNEPLLFTMRD